MITLALVLLALLVLGVVTHFAPGMQKGRVGYPRGLSVVKPAVRLFSRPGQLLAKRLKGLVRSERARRGAVAGL